MRLSRKADYALRVLFDLIDARGQGPVSLTTLANRNDVPKRFLEHIMLDLKSEGWVESSPGRFGGYFFAGVPEEITVGQVVRRFDGLIDPVGCVSATKFEACTQSGRCRFRRLMLEVRDRTAALLDGATLADVAGNEPIPDRDVLELTVLAGGGI